MFLDGILHKGCAFPSTSHLEVHNVHLPLICDVNFDDLFHWFLHCIVTILLTTNKQSVWRYFKTIKISCCSSKFLPLYVGSVDDNLLEPVFNVMVLKWRLFSQLQHSTFTGHYLAFYCYKSHVIYPSMGIVLFIIELIDSCPPRPQWLTVHYCT